MREREDGEGLEEWDGEILKQITLVPTHPCHLFVFLSDPSPIFVYPCYLLTDSRLVDLIDVTLVYEDTNSKLV